MAYRLVEDYAIVYCGDTLFKVMRLILVGASSVHFFACVFFRVKILSANTEDDVTTFYTSRNIEADVRVQLESSSTAMIL
jgi:hypothetical protein